MAIAVAMAEARIAGQVGMPDLGRDYLEFLAELGYGLDPFEFDAMLPRQGPGTDGCPTAEAGDAA